LVSINHEEIKTSEEKIEIYKGLNKDILFDLEEFMEKVDFGIFYEFEAFCPECGTKSKRLLQHEIIPYELLPAKTDSDKRKAEHHRRFIYFGK
jgi:hypothetical protein